MEDKNTGEGLKRVIGVPALAATVVNNTIGAGIYVLPAIVSVQMGAAGILGYLFCGAMLVAIMLCYMEIGGKVTASGGSYIYVETAFGPFAGFIVNWLFDFEQRGNNECACRFACAVDPGFFEPDYACVALFYFAWRHGVDKYPRRKAKCKGFRIHYYNKAYPAFGHHPFQFQPY